MAIKISNTTVITDGRQITNLATPLEVTQGGTGAGTLTGILVGNGTSAVTVKTNPAGAFVGTTDTQTLENKTLTAPSISGGTLDNAIIGATTAAAATFTNLTASGAATLNGNVGLGDAGTDTVTVSGQLSANSSVGASGQVLTSRGANQSPQWTTPLATPVSVANGGTGQSSYVNGELLIGNTTGNTLTKATLTAGSGISITNGAGSITVASNRTGCGQIFVYTGSAQTFTVPAGVTSVKVTVIGGGGGSGSALDQTFESDIFGGGGGSGGVSIRQVTGLTPGATVTVTVGQGGAGGVAGANGGSGGTSSFGAFASATGGGGGTYALFNLNSTRGSNGTGSSGDINLSAFTSPELASVGFRMFPSMAPLYGGIAQIPGSTGNGTAGINVGSGAAGARDIGSNIWRTGGAGSPGVVIVEY